jgi:excisionase family DNA binding protein
VSIVKGLTELEMETSSKRLLSPTKAYADHCAERVDVRVSDRWSRDVGRFRYEAQENFFRYLVAFAVLLAPFRVVVELPTLLDIAAVSERLHVTERHVRRLVAERRIPFVKVGRFVRFDPADVADWIRAALARGLSHPLSMIDVDRSARRAHASGSGSRR